MRSKILFICFYLMLSFCKLCFAKKIKKDTLFILYDKPWKEEPYSNEGFDEDFLKVNFVTIKFHEIYRDRRDSNIILKRIYNCDSLLNTKRIKNLVVYSDVMIANSFNPQKFPNLEYLLIYSKCIFPSYLSTLKHLKGVSFGNIGYSKFGYEDDCYYGTNYNNIIPTMYNIKLSCLNLNYTNIFYINETMTNKNNIKNIYQIGNYLMSLSTIEKKATKKIKKENFYSFKLEPSWDNQQPYSFWDYDEFSQTYIIEGKKVKGKYENEWLIKNSNGNILQKRYYKNGIEVGTWLGFNEKGDTTFKAYFRNGELEKFTRVSYKSGDTNLYTDKREESDLYYLVNLNLDYNRYYSDYSRIIISTINKKEEIYERIRFDKERALIGYFDYQKEKSNIGRIFSIENDSIFIDKKYGEYISNTANDIEDNKANLRVPDGVWSYWNLNTKKKIKDEIYKEGVLIDTKQY